MILEVFIIQDRYFLRFRLLKETEIEMTTNTHKKQMTNSISQFQINRNLSLSIGKFYEAKKLQKILDNLEAIHGARLKRKTEDSGCYTIIQCKSNTKPKQKCAYLVRFRIHDIESKFCFQLESMLLQHHRDCVDAEEWQFLQNKLFLEQKTDEILGILQDNVSRGIDNESPLIILQKLQEQEGFNLYHKIESPVFKRKLKKKFDNLVGDAKQKILNGTILPILTNPIQTQLTFNLAQPFSWRNQPIQPKINFQLVHYHYKEEQVMNPVSVSHGIPMLPTIPYNFSEVSAFSIFPVSPAQKPKVELVELFQLVQEQKSQRNSQNPAPSQINKTAQSSSIFPAAVSNEAMQTVPCQPQTPLAKTMAPSFFNSNFSQVQDMKSEMIKKWSQPFTWESTMFAMQ